MILSTVDQSKFKPITPGNHVGSLFAPLPYSNWWYLGCLASALVILASIALAFVYTLPYSTLKKHWLTRGISHRIVKRKFIKTLNRIERKIKSGTCDLHDIYAEIDHTVRTYLQFETGLPVRSMDKAQLSRTPLINHLPQIGVTDLGRYSESSDPAIVQNLAVAKNLIASWS